MDGTVHEVLALDPRPFAFSGIGDCVTHSLAVTDKGLFDVGRYPAASLAQASKAWQWFIHRQFLKPEELQEAGKSAGESPDLVHGRLMGNTELG